jgi:hypothetical protein
MWDILHSHPLTISYPSLYNVPIKFQIHHWICGHTYLMVDLKMKWVGGEIDLFSLMYNYNNFFFKSIIAYVRLICRKTDSIISLKKS